MPSAFFFHRARRILFRQDEKEWGVQSRSLRCISPVITGTPAPERAQNSLPQVSPRSKRFSLTDKIYLTNATALHKMCLNYFS